MALLSQGELARLGAAMSRPTWSTSGGLLQTLDTVAAALAVGDTNKARAIIDQMRAVAYGRKR